MSQQRFDMQPYKFDELGQGRCLTILANVPAQRLKAFVELLLPELGSIEVLANRTGLVMVPTIDTVQGTNFHLGEVLVADAHVRITLASGEIGEGYGVCLGRDLEQSLAIAIVDAALQCGAMIESIISFVEAESIAQEQKDDQLLRSVEATRVELETF